MNPSEKATRTTNNIVCEKNDEGDPSGKWRPGDKLPWSVSWRPKWESGKPAAGFDAGHYSLVTIGPSPASVADYMKRQYRALTPSSS